MVELIITEKPAAAKKIADALADGKAIKKAEKGVPYYELTHGNQDIIVGCAVGHLYGIGEKEKKGFVYPTFDVKWVLSADENKAAAFSRKYAMLLKKLAKKADTFTVACDYDIEGEVIGLNVIRYICKQKDAARMKFSTLTKPDLLLAYENKSLTLDWGQANAGETRHILDYYYGINLSRALTCAIKTTGMFKILSIGRVQGPALKIVVDREKEIKAFVPEPYWQIQLIGNEQGSDVNIEAWHVLDKIFEKEKADSAYDNVKGSNKGTVKALDRHRFNQAQPFPFDLTSLQIEAYRVLRINPKDTLDIAQKLYTSGAISYPRTSSQQLPPSIGYSKIFAGLAKQNKYTELAKKIKPGTPNNGKKVDPAHPAIYPTGLSPGNIKDREEKLYDLIVKRFFATFADPATRETMTVTIDVNSEEFIAKGTRTVERGWHVFYDPYVKLEELELPDMKQNDVLEIKEINLLDKETQPPKRYTPSSIIKALEKKGLGTKSTRAQIVETLFHRCYAEGNPMQATELGMQTIETLQKYSPDIIDEELTKTFEEEMEKIRQGDTTEKNILEEAKNFLVKILTVFKEKEKIIGEELSEANKEAIRKATTIGKCPKCKEGELVLRKGKFGRFIACNRHPDCETTYNIPNTGMIKPTDKVCEVCGCPMILVIKKRKQPQEICINKDCKSKGIPEQFDPKPCPKCKEGMLILRKSIYGAFIACNRFPKCRYIGKLDSIKENKEEVKK